MSNNRIRRSNTIQSRRIWIIAAVCLVATVFGFVFVFLKNRNIQLANELKDTEKVLAEVSEKNRQLTLRVQENKSGVALQQRIRQFGLEMVDISILQRQNTAVGGGEALAARKERP
jgi:hypothetical protein